jgi:hypothetical protein
MSTKTERLQTALDAIHARENAKRPKPVEPVKKSKAVKEPVEPVIVEEPYPHAEVVDELDAIGEGDQ